MARQNINIGVTSNDGTGDPLRDAMDKVNDNFTELYANVANMFDGTYASLTGKPTIPATLLDLGISDGTAAGQVLSTDGAGNFTFVDATAGNDAGIDAHLNTSTAATNEVLSWNGSDYDWVAQSGGTTYTDSDAVAAVEAVNLDMGSNSITTTGPIYFSNNFADTNALPNATTFHGMFAHVHAEGRAYFAHNGAWVGIANQSEIGGGGGGSSLQTRSSATGTSTSLADGDSANIEVTGFKGYALLKIETDRAAWVRIYTDAASRTADAGRAETSDPAPDAGVIAEVITTGAQTVVISPGTIGFSNESTPDTTIPVRVTNKSGSTSTVQVVLTVLQLEA